MIKPFHIHKNFYYAMGITITVFLFGHPFPDLFPIAKLLFICILCFTLIDFILLFFTGTVTAERITSPKFSNGDFNPVSLVLKSSYPFEISGQLFDDIPLQFQIRDHEFTFSLKPNEGKTKQYSLRPVERGEFKFGDLHIYISTQISFLKRKCTIPQEFTVSVYPSFIHMNSYEL